MAIRRAKVQKNIKNSVRTLINALEGVRRRRIFNNRVGDEQKRTNYFEDFSINTSLHGVKYISENERSLAERIWWSVMVICSFCICAYLVAQVWDKWTTSPVIVTFDEKLTPAWKIPFPAVTICPMNKINKTLFDYEKICETKKAKNYQQQQLFDLYNAFCDHNCLLSWSKHIVDADIALEELKYVSLSPENQWQCQLFVDMVNGADFFSHILTEYGWCYTFNFLHHDDIYSDEAAHDEFKLIAKKIKDGWSFDNGYPKSAPFYTFPRRARISTSSLILELEKEQNYPDTRCTDLNQGELIAIHPIHVVPRQKDFFQAPYGKFVDFKVKPSMMYTSDALKDYEPEKRQCYFSYERKLRFYKNYTREFCESECITNYTMATCGCALVGMPRDENMPLCAGGNHFCLDLNLSLLSMMEPIEELPEGIWDQPKEFSDWDWWKEIGFGNWTNDALAASYQCNCMQSCTSISYETTRHIHEKDMKRYEDLYYITPNNETRIVTYITVDMVEKSFIMSKRSELYSITDFLANCGGLIGVCLGFSMLSLVEIIYFFIIRVLVDLKKKKNKARSSTQQVIVVQP